MRAEILAFGLEWLPHPESLRFSTLNSVDCEGTEHVISLSTSIHILCLTFLKSASQVRREHLMAVRIYPCGSVHNVIADGLIHILGIHARQSLPVQDDAHGAFMALPSHIRLC
jgi:hypothetical protein